MPPQPLLRLARRRMARRDREETVRVAVAGVVAVVGWERLLD
jgi:hypothetical protein